MATWDMDMGHVFEDNKICLMEVVGTKNKDAAAVSTPVVP